MLGKRDVIYFGLLVVLALFIWTRDLAWSSSLDDTLPILVALPLFVWVLWPWRLRGHELSLTGFTVLSLLVFLVGIASNLTLLLAIAWSLLLWDWVRQRVVADQRRDVANLMLLPVMAFPWITLDAQAVGWWFRLSGAAKTASAFSMLGMEVQHQGTHLVINGLPVYVDAACAGLNTLQSLLIAGTLLAFVQLKRHPLYWVNIMLLVPIAWIANTLRIMMLAGAAITVSTEFAMGTFHDLGGLAVLMTMFLLCWALFGLQARTFARRRAVE